MWHAEVKAFHASQLSGIKSFNAIMSQMITWRSKQNGKSFCNSLYIKEDRLHILLTFNVLQSLTTLYRVVTFAVTQRQ